MIVVRVWRGLELNLFAAVNVVVARTQKEGGANKQNREGEALLFERDVSALVSVDIFQPNFDDDDDGCQDDRGVPRPVSEGTRAFVGLPQSRAHRYTARARSCWHV